MTRDPFTAQMIKAVSWMHLATYRMGGWMLPFNRNILILTAKGRKTGRESSKPLLFYDKGGKLHLVGSYGGSDKAPDWYLNLVANPEVKVEVGAKSGRYRARTLSAQEAKEVWPGLLAIYPNYAEYQKKTTRQIPIVELSSL
jgi:deazaflavin-dependent oxidoreductase (nitroreductase family)